MVDISDIGNGNLTEVANFDTFPSNNGTSFSGAWSNYPFFDSGTVILGDIQGGLFILAPKLCPVVAPASNMQARSVGDNSIELTWTDSLAAGESYTIYRSEGGCDANNFEPIADQITTELYVDNTASGLVNIGYQVSKISADGTCEFTRSTCSEAQTTGVCTAAPEFSGLGSISNGFNNTCSLNLQWPAATSYCQSSTSYNVYKSTDAAFVPGPENLVASDITDLSWSDGSVVHEETYHYVVRAKDASNQAEDQNNLKLFGSPLGELADGTWTAGAEVGDGGIAQTGRHLGWEMVTTEVFDGERSYWSQNSSNVCNRLTSQPFNLTPGQATELSFFTRYTIEDRWDGGLVEVSVDGGPWTMPTISPDYPNTFRSSSDECGYAENTPAFSGTQNSWQQHTVDLSANQGQQVEVRFSYSTDGSVNDGGWFLDNLALSHVQVPGVCQTVTDLIFADDFE